MAKSLSLKKGKHAAPPKSQKPITQFFKNASGGPSQSSQNNPEKTPNSESNICTNPSNKRKASSPAQDLASGNLASSSNGLINKHNQPVDGDKNYKRVKLENGKVEDSIPNIRNSLANTKEKENHSQSSVSPKSNVEPLDDKISRSPLCSMTSESNSKSQNKSNEYHVFEEESLKNTKLENDVNQTKSLSPHPRRIKTPKKSPITEIRRSPRIAKLLTPEKLNSSPSKYDAVVKALNFDHHNGMGEDFGDAWELNDFEEEQKEDLDLNVMQRCEVVSVRRHPTQIELKLKNATNNRGTCFIEGFWLDTPLCPGEIVSVLASPNSSGKYCVGNTSGLLVLRPDHLLSSTSVVAGVFCKRKAVLQERWKGIDSANVAMTVGTLVHELVQKALTHNISELKALSAEADRIVKESIQIQYDAGLTEQELRTNMQSYIAPLAEFMQTYVVKTPSSSYKNDQKGKWQGHVNKILDIEENLCCPQLGLKGKIDATLEVTIHDRKGNKAEIVPLELKSGKASVSAEHRGQLVLYGMMLALQRGADPARAQQRGLLLYLKDRVELREVSCGHPERRDLLLLRNQLVHDIAVGPGDVDPEQITDIEDASLLLQQRLPEPIHRENVCSKCPYLTLCSLHLWHTNGPSVSESHPLSKLQGQALGHLSPAHIKYFLHWTALLKAEERVQSVTSPLHSLWTDTAEKRENRGTCAANLHLKSVKGADDRFLHVFHRSSKEGCDKTTQLRGPQENEFSIVSIDKRPWIAAGVVTCAKEKEIHIVLERDLSQRLPKSTKFHIDTYESYATTVQNLTNLGVLMEDSDRAERLRSIIIDKVTPEFEPKLPREVGRVGSKLMRRLNVEQQRGVLRALAASHYALLRGLPGTGKTQTISVLIQMLVALKMRVLVTAHTHSAVDNVLSRLPETMKVMRLGPKTRVAPKVAHRCEQQLAAACDTPEQLEQLYNSMEVVGVTCLGANHAMLSRTTFDMCIVDEATQVPQCTVLRPLFAAKRFILVGDPDQLPPVVRSKAARRLGMEESLFHRLMSDQATATLKLQYRMNAPLAALANRLAYRGQLACAGAAVADARLPVRLEKISSLLDRAPWLSPACSPATEHAAVFLDVQAAGDEGRSCANRHEAAVVLALVDAFTQGGVPPEDIGVIAPYREQVSLLRRLLGGRGEASTVDQFQGRDKPLIVLSCTRRAGRDDWQVKEGEVLNDQRRLAVSVTRAKHKLVVIGDSRALRRYGPLSRLLDACHSVELTPDQLAKEMDRYKTVLGG